MPKGTFFLLNDPDMMELVLQEYGRRMAFRGGPQAMADQAERTLDSVLLLLFDQPGKTGERPITFELRFAEEGVRGVAARVEGRIMQTTPEDVEDFILDTEQTLMRSREEAAR